MTKHRTSVRKHETAPSVDDILKSIDDADTKLDEAGASRVMTVAEFKSYSEEQIKKASEEGGEKGKARLAALKEAAKISKNNFETTGSATIPVFRDPWQSSPSTAKGAPPANVPESNIQFPNVEVGKKLKALAKVLADEKSPLRTELAKSADAKIKDLVAKAGEVSTMLDKIAKIFGVERYDEDGDVCRIAWKVSDVIYALEESEKTEKALSNLTLALNGVTVGKATAAPAPAPAPAAPGASAAETPVAKSEYDAPAGGIPNDDGWPLDMSAAARSGVGKGQGEEAIRF